MCIIHNRRITYVSFAGFVAKQAGHQYGLIVSGCAGIIGNFIILPVLIQKTRDRRKDESNIEVVNTATVHTKL